MGNVEWSSDDTKAELIAACEELGIEASVHMLKVEIVSLLEGVSEEDVMTSVDTKSDSYEASASYAGDPTAPIPDKPKPPKKQSEVEGVMGILRAAKNPVSFEMLVNKIGPGAKDEVNKLVKSGAVCSHKRGNKLWFIAN